MLNRPWPMNDFNFQIWRLTVNTFLNSVSFESRVGRQIGYHRDIATKLTCTCKNVKKDPQPRVPGNLPDGMLTFSIMKLERSNLLHSDC